MMVVIHKATTIERMEVMTMEETMHHSAVVLPVTMMKAALRCCSVLGY